MARININNIENVEGEYHLMFYEGKNIVESAKNDIRFAWLSFLGFFALLFLFVVISDFNLFYAGFAVVFLIFFVLIYIYLKRQKRKGIKQCIYAVQKSKTNNIIARQVDKRSRNKIIMKSVTNTIDKYDVNEKFPKFSQRLKRKHKNERIVDAVNKFEGS